MMLSACLPLTWYSSLVFPGRQFSGKARVLHHCSIVEASQVAHQLRGSMTTRHHHAKGRGLDACYDQLLGMPVFPYIYICAQLSAYTTSFYPRDSRMRHGSFAGGERSIPNDDVFRVSNQRSDNSSGYLPLWSCVVGCNQSFVVGPVAL